MTTKTRLTGPLAALLLAAAAPSPAATYPAPPPGHITFGVAGIGVTKGTYVASNGTAEFEAENLAPAIFRVKVVLNGTTGFVVDWDGTTKANGFVRVSFTPAPLRPGDQLLLLGLHAELAKAFPYPDTGDTEDLSFPHQGLLRTFVGWLAEAPDHAEGTYEVSMRTLDQRPQDPPPEGGTGGPGWGGGGCSMTCTLAATGPNDFADEDGVAYIDSSCCTGTGLAASYTFDDNAGPVRQFNCCNRCGQAAGCTGRCGPGCVSFPRYTQDCMDHDKCVDHLAAGSGPWDPYCADEFSEGVNDVVELTILYLVVPDLYGSIVSWTMSAVGLAYCQ